MGKHVATDIGDDSLAEGDDEVVAAGRGYCEDSGQHQQHGKIGVDEALVTTGETVVDHAAHGHRQRQRGAGSQCKKDESAENQARIAT